MKGHEDSVPASAPATGGGVLLHVCCAGCAGACIERLRASGYAVRLFFYNPNLWPPDEYARRRDGVRRLAERFAVQLIEGSHDHAKWLHAVRGLEQEPERGRRCRACFAFNLERTAREARAHGLPFFTTTLSVSPHKTSADIMNAGKQCAGFLAIDFKKKGGFQRSVEISRRYDLSRQHYCGCEFSRRNFPRARATDGRNGSACDR